MKFKFSQDDIILTQTDTTVGFLSKNVKNLNRIKKRKLNTPCLLTSSYLSEIKNFSRIPNAFKNEIRKSKKTSFILSNSFSFRLVNDEKHSKFLKENGFFYSSSANIHKKKFDETWARKVANIVLGDNFCEKKPSNIIKLSRSKRLKIR